MISIVCVLYVIFILRNLQKNGWEREKSWITFGHTYYIYKAAPHLFLGRPKSEQDYYQI